MQKGKIVLGNARHTCPVCGTLAKREQNRGFETSHACGRGHVWYSTRQIRADRFGCRAWSIRVVGDQPCTI